MIDASDAGTAQPGRDDQHDHEHCQHRVVVGAVAHREVERSDVAAGEFNGSGELFTGEDRPVKQILAGGDREREGADREQQSLDPERADTDPDREQTRDRRAEQHGDRERHAWQ